MDTNRRAPTDLAGRDRATRRLNQLTTGVAVAGAIAVVGFGALAAATDRGATTTTITTDASTSTGATSTSPTLGSGVAPEAATGPAHATTGGS